MDQRLDKTGKLAGKVSSSSLFDVRSNARTSNLKEVSSNVSNANIVHSDRNAREIYLGKHFIFSMQTRVAGTSIAFSNFRIRFESIIF